MTPELIVITGPTASGKTSHAIKMAQQMGCEIVSADSRQVYREMRIGTAVPTNEELAAARHHMIQCRSVLNPMNAYDYEQEVLSILPDVMRRGGGHAILVGGSMMYIDAICNGIDEMPTISREIRSVVRQRFEHHGLEQMQLWLKKLDPDYYHTVELRNPRRVLHAIEICLQSGIPYSTMRHKRDKERPFSIRRIEMQIDRNELYEKIENRVDMMIECGLVDEAKSLLPLKHLSPLNTVGYRELFDYLEGRTSIEEAVRLIKRNTRHYAKKQLTWLKSNARNAETASVNK